LEKEAEEEEEVVVVEEKEEEKEEEDRHRTKRERKSPISSKGSVFDELKGFELMSSKGAIRGRNSIF